MLSRIVKGDDTWVSHIKLESTLFAFNIIVFFAVSSVVRSMSGHGHNMKIEVSRWQWHKFKDLLHFYTMLGVIPATLIVFLTNIYIGPAKLAEIPEGYTPKHWEYHKVCHYNLILS